MPGSILLSGPAGGGKSQRARELLAESPEPAIIVDFQQTYAQILAIERDPETGRYPERKESDSFAIPLTTEIRLGMLAAAKAQQVAVIMTNSDGDLGRRQRLLGLMPDGATEQVIDPGEAVVRARLTNRQGLLSDQCKAAVMRWYGRIPLGGIER